MLEYCTLFDANYLAQGLALYESISKHHEDYRLHILTLCEKSFGVLKKLGLPNIILYLAADVETPELRSMRPRLSSSEYIWVFKPGFIMLTLLKTRHVAYVDADSYFFNTCDISSIGVDDKTPTAVTPHRFTPIHEHFAINGAFNAGFIFAARAGIPCLKDWNHRCIADRRGIITDQVHLNNWPEQWGAHIIRHKGINLAPWNQAGQYRYSVRKGQVYVDDDPLIWYHFHQGLKPSYNLAPFVRTYIYEPYREALGRAREIAHL